MLSMVNYDVARLEKSSIEPISKLFVDAFKSPPWNENWSVAAAYERLIDIFNTPKSLGVVLVDPQNSLPVAFALGVFEVWHNSTHFQIKELCVHPEKQRQHLGHVTVEAIIQAAKDQGAKEIYLLTACESPAEKMYHSRGFSKATQMQVMELKVS